MHKISNHKWEKFGKIISKDKNLFWTNSHTSSPCVTEDLQIYFTARDKNNISRIGKGKLVLDPVPTVENITEEPILELGEQGSFDYNGTSYPYVVDNHLYYTGWFPGVAVPFINNLGLATIKDGSAERISRAPLLPSTDDEPFGIGSVCVIKEESWHMWYTCFTKWVDEKHYYHIRYATSDNGIDWKRDKKISIDFKDDEFAICRPSVVKHKGIYHMVYCYRGNKYKLGYAYSKDKVNWTRDDSALKLEGTKNQFDSQEMCYPFWFKHNNFLYLIYCGNNYGNSGIGIARLEL